MQSLEYLLYLAENLDSSIDYAEYMSDNIKQSTSYSEYIAESLSLKGPIGISGSSGECGISGSSGECGLSGSSSSCGIYNSTSANTYTNKLPILDIYDILPYRYDEKRNLTLKTKRLVPFTEQYANIHQLYE